MKITHVSDLGSRQVENLLSKKMFDEIKLSDSIRKTNLELFGEDLSAHELVHRIVQDVRYNGNKALFYYTKIFDHIELTDESFFVSEAEFQNAENMVDPSVIESLKRAQENIYCRHALRTDDSCYRSRISDGFALLHVYASACDEIPRFFCSHGDNGRFFSYESDFLLFYDIYRSHVRRNDRDGHKSRPVCTSSDPRFRVLRQEQDGHADEQADE